jgi:hypothetical protein
MKVVFVSGPYTTPSPGENAKVIIELAIDVARAGAMPVAPNLMTDSRFMQVQNYAWWVCATSTLLWRCDAIIFTHDYARSHGALSEEAIALNRGIPCFYDVPELEEWLKVNK